MKGRICLAVACAAITLAVIISLLNFELEVSKEHYEIVKQNVNRLSKHRSEYIEMLQEAMSDGVMSYDEYEKLKIHLYKLQKQNTKDELINITTQNQQ